MTREQLDYFSECVKEHFGDDSTAMNAAHYGLMWAETKVDNGELATLRAENEQLIEDKKNLNITIENAAEWSQKQAASLALLSEALQRCKKWFFQHAPTAVLPDGTGQEAHREISELELERSELQEAATNPA